MNNMEDSACNEFFKWLNVHKLGYMMMYDHMSRDVDYGYVKACNVIEGELQRLIEEYRDENH